ncbi:hypothetical protein B6I65_19070 [Klebsiella pneumoniae]|uniref:hypothetical protein n=1 Tax=Klebsiella pneumoniae TaxID=573 RepID=UPI000C79A7BD|nr:hypothetical protein [Klebsiella pneumoniae]PLD93432.1 hypothetical protein B6I65_19070 [Klebsiella pneumoniae]
MTIDITELAQREKFEAWFVNDVVGADVTFPAFEDGAYAEGEIYDEQFYFMLQAMWMAWKAAGAELVEALEKAQLRIDEMESDEVRQRLANAEYQLYMAELAKNNLRASRKAQFRKRKAAEKRIAELESRTVNVKLPTAIEPAAFSPWVAKAFYQFHKDTVKSCFAVFSDACDAAGIKVEAE